MAVLIALSVLSNVLLLVVLFTVTKLVEKTIDVYNRSLDR